MDLTVERVSLTKEYFDIKTHVFYSIQYQYRDEKSDDDTTDESDDGEIVTTRNGVPESTAETNDGIKKQEFDHKVSAIHSHFDSLPLCSWILA